MNRKMFEEIISKMVDTDEISIYVNSVDGGNIGSSSCTRFCNTRWSNGDIEVCKIIEVCDEYVVLYAGKICGSKRYTHDVYLPYSSILYIKEFGAFQWREE